MSSIRPYAQSRGYSKRSTPPKIASEISTSLADPLQLQSQTNASLIGQPIAPWPVLIAAVSPAKDRPKDFATKKVTPLLTFKPGHKRTMTPAPEPEPEPVLQPLKPARSKAIPTFGSTQATIRAPGSHVHPVPDDKQVEPLPLPSGVRSRRGSMTLDELSSPAGGSLTPVFKRLQDAEDPKRASLCPADYRGKHFRILSDSSPELDDLYGESFSVPIAREVRKALGMSGTLGGSDVSRYDGPPPDASDPDSDVPEELKFILAAHSDRESLAESLCFQEEHGTPVLSPTAPSFSAPPPSEPLPPLDRPVFRAALIDDDQNRFEIDGECMQSSDEDTKKSFDFTGELKKLNESGASDRASFVEQLEIAFKTPAKIDLRCGFGTHLQVEAPPVPCLPLSLDNKADSFTSYAVSSDLDIPFQSQLLDIKQLNTSPLQDTPEQEGSIGVELDDQPTSRLVDTKEPSLLHDLTTKELDCTESDNRDTLSIELARLTDCRLSSGELDRSFRFGGPPKDSSPFKDESKSLTLSDIIPPPDCARAIAEASLLLDDLEDDSVLNSIYAKLMSKGSNGHIPALNEIKLDKVASRPVSGISFVGLESFDEVRRGFEFTGDRSFYPPPARTTRRPPHVREDSVFSIASVSSYGRVVNNGVSDPFDYGLPSLRERPSSEDMSSISMSMTVEDTFAFIRGQPRQRVESDASSFYFRDIAHAARGHGRRESNISITSQAPPISRYNRSFGHHRRNESTASSSSVAISYAKYGANSGMLTWARHRRDVSMDSVSSDFSGMHLGRPGIGDKMFDHAVDLGPLTSISASPPEKLDISDSHSDHRSSFDSILDDDQRPSIEDSLFEKTGHRSSISSDSVFGEDNCHPYQGGLLPPNQFRPLSVLSVNSVHSPMEEGDTMIPVSSDS